MTGMPKMMSKLISYPRTSLPHDLLLLLFLLPKDTPAIMQTFKHIVLIIPAKASMKLPSMRLLHSFKR